MIVGVSPLTSQRYEQTDFAVSPLRLFPLDLNFFHRCFLDKIMSTCRAEVSIYHKQSINKYYSTYLKIRADWANAGIKKIVFYHTG